MATWHQIQARKHPGFTLQDLTQWSVIIDPPGEMSASMLFPTKALADVYMRNLQANNPGAYRHAYVLKPAGR